MSKLRILVVDDEKDVRTIIRATLEDKYEVVEAQDGLDALEKINRVEPDLIVLDIMMPLMNGYDTCETIRKKTHFSKIPILFLSALTDKEQIKKGYTSGATLYLTKPFEPDRLLKNVDLFFKQSSPSMKPKRYKIEDLLEIEKSPPPVPPPSLPAEFAPGPVPQFQALTDEKIALLKQEMRDMEKKPASQMRKEEKKGLSPRVMVVDDDQNVIDYLFLILRDKFEVVWAEDGFQAIEKIVSYEPDILLLDLMIPKVSGYQLCNSIRKNRAFGSIPIIIISAKTGKKDVDYAFRMGANAYIKKPFEPQELIDTVERFINLPTFQVKTKNVPYTQILETEHKQIPEIEADDVKYIRRMEKSEEEK